jgi:hypothetical protein
MQHQTPASTVSGCRDDLQALSDNVSFKATAADCTLARASLELPRFGGQFLVFSL